MMNLMRQIDLNEVHAILLEMAKYFHQICQKHGIGYYMLGGTMLGAVRHKGFFIDFFCQIRPFLLSASYSNDTRL